MTQDLGKGTAASAVNETTADRSIGQLIGDLSEQLSRLVRDEIRLATSELQQKGKRFGTGAGLAGAAGFLALLGVATLVAAAVLGLATVMAGWAAALVVAAALFVIAAVAGLLGKNRIQQATPPVPEEAVARVQQDVNVVKESARK